MAEFIRVLKPLIKTGQVEKIKSLLNGIDIEQEDNQQVIVETLALAPDQPAPDQPALDLLASFLDTLDPKHPLHSRLFQLAMDRAHLNYKFVLLLMNHADCDQINQIIPLLKHILTRETKGDLLDQIIKTIGQLKLEVLVDDVAEFIFYDDPNLRHGAVKALEQMGSITALNRLEQIANTGKCDKDILDSLAFLKKKLGSDSLSSPTLAQKESPRLTGSAPHFPKPSAVSQETDLISKTRRLTSDRIEERFKAYLYFSENGCLVAEALHANMESQEPDLMINLLRLVARTIPKQSIADLLTLADRQGIEAPVKFSIYTALAQYPELESVAPIIKGITDPAMHLRMAAVKALDRHCSDFAIAEVKKEIESGTKSGERLGITILDAKAVKLINGLMDSDTFSYITSNYLERSAPAQVIDAYISVLEKRNLTSTIKKYRQLRLKRTETEKPFFVIIHPCTTFLDVYAALIHRCGFNTHTFTGPQKAFESIVFEKPIAVICDFFVRQMTVMDLAKEIRELYTQDQVPVIVSSLQKHLDQNHLSQEFKTAGINQYHEFPPSLGQIKSWAGAR
ncbi:MAG: hypothetical protein HUN05_10490 [Desulfobacter sp.]|nr:MAG: hypothetical protein HUN05_10490 [Desulfobacter sp.]